MMSHYRAYRIDGEVYLIRDILNHKGRFVRCEAAKADCAEPMGDGNARSELRWVRIAEGANFSDMPSVFPSAGRDGDLRFLKSMTELRAN